MKTQLLNFLIFLVFFVGGVFRQQTSFGQTVTFADENAPANGITADNLRYGQPDMVLYGFKVTVTGSAANISIFNINSGSTLASLFSNFRLYKAAPGTTTFSGSTLVKSFTVSSAAITITGLTESFSVNQSNTYFIVADFITTSGSLTALPTTRGFTLNATKAAQQTSPTAKSFAAPSGNLPGFTFNLLAPEFDNTDANTAANGITQGDLISGQTDIVMFGFGLSAPQTTTISSFKFNLSKNPTTYFSNGRLYRSTSSTFSFGTATLVTTFTFPSATSLVISGLSESFTYGDNVTEYYFIVGDYTGTGTTPATEQISQLSTTSSSVVQSAPVAKNLTVANDVTGASLSLVNSLITITGSNAVINGITQGSITYGQTDIVLFGFKMSVVGINTVKEIDIPTNIPTTNYFTNGQFYRSTDSVFSAATATLIAGGATSGTVSFTTNTTIKGLSETFTTPTIYYYFLVGDFTKSASFTAPATIQYNFVSGTNSVLLSVPTGGVFNTANTTNGNVFNVVNSYNWIGGISGDFSNIANFKTTNNGSVGSLPDNTITVNIGVNKSYTNAPVITASTTVGGVLFSNSFVASPVLTIASGQTLTLNNSLVVSGSSTATITGPGTLALASTDTANIAPSSVLNLTGGATLSNAGLFTMASSSILNLNGSNLNNTGTFTLTSDADGTATIGQLMGTCTITGNYQAQRFVTGGPDVTNGRYVYRNYRLMSSPVHTATDASGNFIYPLSYIANSAIVTDATGGYNQTGNPTLYLFRENTVPNNSSFVSGNYRGVSNISTTDLNIINDTGNPYHLPVGNGFLFYYRGDLSSPTIKTTSPYTAPENTTFSAIGTLNYGNITFHDWFTPSSGNLSFTTTIANNVTGSNIRGYNLVGNPYPSSISWTSVYNANSGGGHLNSTIYEFNPITNQYGAYIAGGTGTGGFGDVIASGQGFFALANDASAQINFTEANKVASSQPSTLLLGVPVTGIQAQQYLHLKMIKDTFNYDDVIIGFKPNADEKFVLNEDALHLTGNAPAETLISLSSDSVGLSINYISPNKKQQVVGLYVDAIESGTYRFSREELVGIPALYEIWLKDNLQKDSLDMRANTTYDFKIDKNDAASFGADRFQVVIRQNPALGLHLLDFTADKAPNLQQVKVDWKVENEDTYTTFYVQRSVDGGKTFLPIGSLQADNTGVYTFIDQNPSSGQNQYRLQLSDVNNAITYSSIIIIQYSDLSNKNIGSNLALYPNPVHDLINIAVTDSSANAVSYTLTITNSTGGIIKTFTSSQTTWQNNVNDLLPGTYFIQVVNNNTKAITGRSKFVKI